MKLFQYVLLIMLAAGIHYANAAETKKFECPKLKQQNWNNEQKELAAAKYLNLWDGPKGRETLQTAPKAAK
jgi:hypothetical protein